MTYKELLYNIIPFRWGEKRKTSFDYDLFLNDLLDKYKIQRADDCLCKINDYIIWVGNYPYSFGYVYKFPCGNYNFNEVLPKMKTRKRLCKIVEEYNYKVSMWCE